MVDAFPVTEMLKDTCLDEWQAVTRHPFCAELADGSLPAEKMARYLVQDYAFVDGFVRLAASAIAHAPSLKDSVTLAQFLAVITGPENTYFLRSFEALDVSEQAWKEADFWQVTKDFQGLMAEAAASGCYEQMLAVLIVAEWSYLSWATPYNPPQDALPFYFSEWITLHAGEGFEDVVSYLRGQLEALWPSLDEQQRGSVRDMFERAVTLEQRFFDMAYAS